MGGTALVLGGGGVTGIAWEVGVLAGLAERGLDLAAADRIIGTSAGSVVGAQLASGVPVERLFETQLTVPAGLASARIPLRTVAFYVLSAVRGPTAEAHGARVGRMALRTRTMPEAERRAVIAAALPGQQWPERTLEVTAIDAESGKFTVFDRDSGVSLLDAIGASCAVPGVWPPVTIDGRRYIDGGMRSPANADLAAGADRVVVVAPITRGRRGARVPVQLARLIAGGANAVAVSPDQAARRAIGRNVLDPSRRAGAARAGRAQAAAIHAAVAEVWR